MTTDRSYKWLVVVMLWHVCLFNYADRQAISSVFELLELEFGLNEVQLGFVGSSFGWAYAVALPLAGLIGDRFSRKTLILGGLLFWSLVTLATALATEYWHLLLFRILEGLGEAFYFPASMSLISDYHGPQTRSRAMALHQTSVYAGTILGGGLAGFLAQYYGWRSGFYVFGTSGLLLGILLWGALKEPQRGQADWREEPQSPARPAAPRAVPAVALLIVVFMGANFVAMIFLTWLPSFLRKKFDMSLGMAGLSGTAYLQIASMIGALCGGVLADWLSRRYRRGRMLSQAIGLLLGVPFIALTGWTQTVPVLILAMSGFGFFKGLYDANIWAALYDEVPTKRRATAQGVMNSLGWFAGASGPVAIAAAAMVYGMSACLSATSLIYLGLGLTLVFGYGVLAYGSIRREAEKTTDAITRLR